MLLLDKLAAYELYLPYQMKGVDTMINLLKNNDGLTLKDNQLQIRLAGCRLWL